MNRIIGLSLLLVSFSLSVFAGGSKEDKRGGEFAGNYAFGGSTTVEPIAVAAIEALKEIYPDAKISYDSNGSSTGIKGLIAGTYTLGGASRSLKPSEIEKGVIPHAIAYDGVAVVVNKNTVPFDNISHSDLVKVFSGEVTNWSQIGGPDAKIVLINRDEASGTRATFYDMTVKKEKKDFTDSAVIVTGNGDMVSKVGATPYAIGYCGFGYIKKDPGTKAVSVDRIKPTNDNVLSGSYPISRSLILGSLGPIKEGSFEESFLNFILSDQGQEIVAEEKFIPIN